MIPTHISYAKASSFLLHFFDVEKEVILAVLAITIKVNFFIFIKSFITEIGLLGFSVTSVTLTKSSMGL